MRSVKSRRLGTKVTAAALAAAMVPVVATGTANAQQQQGGSIQYTKATEGTPVVETPLKDGRLIVSVWSPSMNVEVPNIVQKLSLIHISEPTRRS